MVSRIPISEVSGRLADLIERVRAGEEFLVERAGTDVCRIVAPGPSGLSVEGMVELMKTIPRPDEGFFDDVEQAARNQPPASPPAWE